jgi:hypothetical protein
MQNDLLKKLEDAMELSRLKSEEIRASLPLVTDLDVKKDLELLARMGNNPANIDEKLLNDLKLKYDGLNRN